jgi:hypothetical protein
MEAIGDLLILHAACCIENDPGPDHFIIWRRILCRGRFKILEFLV